MSGVDRLLEVMRRLRDPEAGCPWDTAQTFETIAPYTIEEAYEVADVIAREAWDELPEELGDLLFQVVFHAQMAAERSMFAFEDVAEAIVEKMVRRHPHVFAEGPVVEGTERAAAWEAQKARERRAKNRAGESRLDHLARGLPVLKRAAKLQRIAAAAGFDWPDVEAIVPKLEEEVAELDAAIRAAGGEHSAVVEELGDLLFTCVNIARHLGVDADDALRRANQKFERRFRHLERAAKEAGVALDETPLERLDGWWERAKEEGL